MKKRIIQFLTTYFLFVLLFVLQKPIFMVYYHDLYTNASLGDYFRVMWHGLPLDLSLAGYLTAIPGILLIASAWTNSSILRRIRQGYFGVIAFVMACIFIIDLGLYGFWGFRLDATPIFYFFSSPKDAMASVSFWFVLLGILAILIYAAILYCIFYCVLIREKKPLKIPYRRQNVSLALLLLTAALFIPIRGGFSVSTMNLSKVYFSQDQRMNHAAINPAFSFMYSATHQNNFDKQYRFMGKNTATIIQRLEGNGKIFLPLRGENPVNFPGFSGELGQKRPAAGQRGGERIRGSGGEVSAGRSPPTAGTGSGRRNALRPGACWGCRSRGGRGPP